MSISLQVLFVENSESDAAQILRVLEQAGYSVFFSRVATLDGMEAALRKNIWDVIISDYKMPQFDALTALALLKKKGLDIPFIVVSKSVGQETAVSLMRAGAHDYLIKDNLSRLAAVVERELAEAFRREEYRRSAQSLNESEARYRILFEYSPMSLWEADYSAVKARIDNLRLEGVSDFPTYFSTHSEVVRELAGLVQVLDVNQASLNLYKVDTKMELVDNLDKVIPLELGDPFLVDLNMIAEGRSHFEYETVHCTIDGERIDINLNFAVVSGHEADFSRVIISVQDVSRRKDFERRLRQAESSYRSLVEQLPAVIYTQKADDSGRVLYMSPQVKQLTGFDASNWLTERNFWYKVIHTDDLAMVKAAIVNANRRSEAYRLEYRVVVSGGGLIWVREEAILMFDDNGKPLFWQGVIHDITETKKAESEMLESQRQLAQLMGNLPGMVVHCKLEPDWNMEFVSEGCQDLLGYSSLALTENDGLLFGSRIHPQDRSKVRKSILDDIQKKRSFQLIFRVIDADNQEKWVQEKGQGVYDRFGTPQAMEGFIVDITESRMAEAAIQRHLSDLEVLHQNSLTINRLLKPDEIARQVMQILDKELGWNHIALRLYDPESGQVELLVLRSPGLTEEELLEEAKSTKLSMPDCSLGLSGWVYRTGQSVSIQNVEEDERYFQTYPGIQSGMYVPLRTGEKIIGSLCIESEIENAFNEQDLRLLSTIANQTTISIENSQLFIMAQLELEARKKAETELLQAQDRLEQRVLERTAELKAANFALETSGRLKGEFLASMSHELRTPLTGILGLAEVLQLQTYGDLSIKQLTALQHIESSGRHLLELINDILDFSRLEAGQLEINRVTCQVEQVCQSCLNAVSGQTKAKKIQTSLSVKPEGLMIEADGRRLKQMLLNLLNNAIKFSASESTIGIEVVGDIETNTVNFAVWDTGIGIRTEDIPRLFKAFIQLDARLARQYNGTGLGLALVRSLAELHGGSVDVESTFGVGSRFTIKLPWK